MPNRFKYYLLWIMTSAVLFACKDPRADQRDLNIFDPNNSFVRFNYKNVLVGTAKDTAHVYVQSPLEVKIPVALSAPAQTQNTLIRYTIQPIGSLTEGNNFELRNEEGNIITEKLIVLPPGDFDEIITFRLLTPPPSGTENKVRFEITEINIPYVNLGFPGTQRGKFFEVLIIQ